MNPTYLSQANSPFTRHRLAGPTITFPDAGTRAKVARAGAIGRVLSALGLSLLNFASRPARSLIS